MTEEAAAWTERKTILITGSTDGVGRWVARRLRRRRPLLLQQVAARSAPGGIEAIRARAASASSCRPTYPRWPRCDAGEPSERARRLDGLINNAASARAGSAARDQRGWARAAFAVNYLAGFS